MSVRRALEVITLLADEERFHADGLGVVKVAERLGIDKSQASRILKLLATHGMTERHPDSRAYRLGWRVVAMAQTVGRRELIQVGGPVVASMARSLKGSAALCSLAERDVVTLLAHGASADPVMAPGGRAPACATPAGRVLLTSLDDAELRRLHGTACSHGEATDTFMADMDRIRARGFDVANEPSDHGRLVVAVPVCDQLGRAVAALTVGTMAVTNPRDIDRLIVHVKEAGRVCGVRLAAAGRRETATHGRPTGATGAA